MNARRRRPLRRPVADLLAMQLPARLRETVLRAVGRESPPRHAEALEAVLSWIRTIALPDDALVLETTRTRDVLGFPFPSEPTSRPGPVSGLVASSPRVRFHIRAGLPVALPPQGWRAVVQVRDLVVWERDVSHGDARPLRLGLSEEEARGALGFVRACAEQAVRPAESRGVSVAAGELPRLRAWNWVGVAVWTRGRLRGSMVSTAGPVLRTLGSVAVAACQDPRFARLTADDLEETIFEATLIHPPRIPLTAAEIAVGDTYPDKAIFLHEGTRSGMYLPEVFNVAGQKKLAPLVLGLARDKAGLDGYGPRSQVVVCEVTDVVEAPDRGRAVPLDGPVARAAEGFGPREAAVAACDWLSRIQHDDGAWPQRVTTTTGEGIGLDVIRTAMTAHALAEVAATHRLEQASVTARRAFVWASGARGKAGTSSGEDVILTSAYLGKAALALATPERRPSERGGVEAALPFALEIVARLRQEPRAVSPLVGAHALSFLALLAAQHADSAAAVATLEADLAERFTAALAASAAIPVSLAEWAELGMGPGGLGRRVRAWLAAQQLPSGAFPESTRSAFLYSRGVGKIFEVLADGPLTPGPFSPDAGEATFPWLVSMQYRPDSAYFIPTEHRPRLLGGLRHDAFDTDAWIDAAGHLLLGLARLGRR